MTVSFKGLPFPATDRDDKAEDINKLGQVITRLLRAHATGLRTPAKKCSGSIRQNKDDSFDQTNL